MKTEKKLIDRSKFNKIALQGIFIILSGLLFSCNISNENKISAKNPNGRNDAWGFIGAGGGGAMFYPTVSPFNPDFAFVSCDMTGAFVTYNGGDSWRMFNLHSPVNFYAFDPLDSNTVYANSIGLFKSTDRGNTWSLLYPAPNEINGIVSKGDHANEFVITKDGTIREVLAFAIDPDNSEKLYAVISIDDKDALFISNDGGIKWDKEKELDKGTMNLYIDPNSPGNNRTIYITGTNKVMVLENGNWVINNGPGEVKKVTEYAGGFDPNRNKFILYAITGKGYFNPSDEISGIFYTEDGGESWENRQDNLVSCQIKNTGFPEWRSIATSALHPEVVYISYDNLKVNNDTTSIGVAKSEDFGITWKLAWKDDLTKNGNIPSINFKSGWLNERFDPTWGENPFSIGVSANNPEVVYATDFGRTVRTINGGKTWEQLYTKKKEGAGWMSRGLEVNTGYTVVFDPFDTNHIFLANTDIGLMESSDGGESWLSATNNKGIPNGWQNSTYWLTFDPEVKGKAWAVMSGTHDLPRPKMWQRDGISKFTGGIVLTEDGGKTWKPLSGDVGESAFTHILIDPSSNKESRTLYACAFGKGVYKSVDGGKTWQQKNKGLNNDEPFAWRITRREQDGVLFLIQCRRSDDGKIGNINDGALYKSEDEAETWTPITLPTETNAPMSLVVDPDFPKQILLSAWGRNTKGKFSPDSGGGIFLSKDEGKTWKHVLQKDQHIHDITYDPRNNTYYACGFNGSAYRSIDRGKSWKRIKGYNFKWGKRVDLDPHNPEKIFIVTFGGGVWYGPAAGDDSAVEDIVTPEFVYR